VTARWSPNPVALAPLLLGERPDDLGWAEVERRVEAAFGRSLRGLARRDGTSPSILDRLRSLSSVAPLTLDAALASADVRALVACLPQDVRSAIARLLPYVMPIRDAGFAPVEQGPSPPVRVGRYVALENLDIGGFSWRDPVQGAAYDCYLISSIIALNWTRPGLCEQLLRSAFHDGNGSGVLRFRFRGAPDGHELAMAATVPVTNDTGEVPYARATLGDEAWPALVEKAYAMHVCGLTGDPGTEHYVSLADVPRARQPHEACALLAGGSPQRASNPHVQSLEPPLFDSLAARCCPRGGQRVSVPAMAWTYDEAYDEVQPHIAQADLVAHHAYAVLGWLARAGDAYVVLRNPHGVAARNAAYASGEWQPDGDGESIELGRDGVFALPRKDFELCFEHLGWVESVPDAA
jgi:hypothetical protein